jgi:integrase
MPRLKRFPTKYPGVTYLEVTATGTGKPERVYYIRYRRSGRLIEEKAGRQFQDDMTPARAAQIRARRIQGESSNEERRQAEKTARLAEASRWTITRLWNEYKANRPDLKGIATDENRFKNYIEPAFGEKEPKDLASFDIDRLRIKLLKTRRPATARNVLELLRRVVNFGVRRNLCEGLRFPIDMPRKLNNLKTEDLTPEQLTNLMKTLDAWPDKQTANLVKMAAFTGMRRGELFSLQWEDVDFERGFIAIRDPKGGKDQAIPMSAPVRALLSTHPKSDVSPYVFPGRRGGKRTDAKKALAKIRTASGLPEGFRPLHGLRHAFASMLASSGKVDLYTLQKLLTHKSPAMTQRYAHLRDEALRQASDLVGTLIEQVIGGQDQGKVVNVANQQE